MCVNNSELGNKKAHSYLRALLQTIFKPKEDALNEKKQETDDCCNVGDRKYSTDIRYSSIGRSPTFDTTGITGRETTFFGRDYYEHHEF